MVRILVLPDVHLGKSTNLGKDPIGNGLNSRIQDQKDLLYFALDKAIELKANKIVLTGDIWEDYNPKSNVVVIFIEWIKKCLDNGLKVDIVQGNHDFTRTGAKQASMLQVFNAIDFPGCKVYDKVDTIIDGTLCITYVPFTDRRQLQKATMTEAIAELTQQISDSKNNVKLSYGKRCDIAIGHLAIEGSLWVGDELNEDSNEIFCPASMFDGFSYVFMGHIHKPQVLNNNNPYMEHVGSMDKTSFGEGDKSITLISTDCSDDVIIEHISLPVRELVDINLTIPADCDNQTAFVLQELSKRSNLGDSIVRIKIESNSQSTLNREEVSKLLESFNVHNISSISEISKTEKVLKDDLGIDEFISHKKAIELYVNSLKSYDDSTKSEVLTFCNDIITSLKLEGDE